MSITVFVPLYSVVMQLFACDFYADAVIDNTRYASLKFDIKQDAVLHGFAGYFDTVLYDNVNLSKSLSSIESWGQRCWCQSVLIYHWFILGIHPDTHSPGMFSWFPILFPIKVKVSYYRLLKNSSNCSISNIRLIHEFTSYYTVVDPKIVIWWKVGICCRGIIVLVRT